MTLQKRYLRDLKHNLAFYVATTLLTILSLLLFYLYYISGVGLKTYTDDIFDKQNIEDANFSTYIEISDQEINELERKYNLTLEKQHYLNIEENDVIARVFEKNNKIDLHYILDGRDLENDHEIIVSKGYALNKGIKIGDKLKLHDEEYLVVGYVARPDYLYMLQNINDSDKNIDSFYIAYLNDNDFENLGKNLTQYLVKYNENNSKSFRKEIYDNYFMQSYLAKENNSRITMLSDKPEIFLNTAYAILVILTLLTSILICIILAHKVKNEQKLIGTLAAFGYSKSQIIAHYAGLTILPGLIAGVLTTILIKLFAQSYGNLCLIDYEPVYVKFSLEMPEMLLGIILPTTLYVLSSSLVVSCLLKKDITNLILGNSNLKTQVHKLLVKKDVALKHKLCLRGILANPGRNCILFFGVFLGAFVSIWALGAIDTISHIQTTTLENLGDYNYQYVLSGLMNDKSTGGVTILASSLETLNGQTITLYGIDDSSLIDLKDLNSNPLNIDDRYYITSLCAFVNDFKVGERVELYNSLSQATFTIEISAIVKNDYFNGIYTSKANVASLNGLSPDLYNIILSKEKLEIPEDKIISIINRDTIEDQYATIVSQMNVIIYLFVFIGMIISIVAVYIATSIFVNENHKNISILELMGYNRQGIYNLLLKNNILIIIPSIILAIICAYYAISMIFLSFVDIFGYIIEAHIEFRTILIGVVLTLLAYYLTSYLVSRKITKINLVEALKDNRE